MKRLLTGTVYVLIVFGFFVLRAAFEEPLWFDLLILLFSLCGTYEMCRALKGKLDAAEAIAVQIFSAGGVVCYCVSDAVCRMRGSVNYAPYLTFLVYAAGLMALLCLLVVRHEKMEMSSVGYALLAYCYPSVFLIVLAGLNHMPVYSEIGVLCVFVLCPFADCFAYVFGKLLGKRFPAKMSPHVSPNKTVVGCIGGLLGGAAGAIALFYVYRALARAGALVPVPFFERDICLLLFLALGIATAAFAEAGDLCESAVKRKLGIKDMGKLLPGHGGVLDRIDSALYVSPVLCLLFLLCLMTVG